MQGDTGWWFKIFRYAEKENNATHARKYRTQEIKKKSKGTIPRPKGVQVPTEKHETQEKQKEQFPTRRGSES